MIRTIEEIDFRRLNGMFFKRYRPKEETDMTIDILIHDTTEERGSRPFSSLSSMACRAPQTSEKADTEIRV